MKALLDNALSFHQTALNVQAQRQELLASNIANADTPNYKARDIDFRNGFQGLIGYRQEQQSSVDGNTVNMDVERAAFAENSLHYEASVTFINGLLRGMQTAITGQ